MQRHKYHHLTNTLHLTLKMTIAQVVETSVTNHRLSKDSSHPDNHTIDKQQITFALQKIPLQNKRALERKERLHITMHFHSCQARTLFTVSVPYPADKE